MTLSASIVIVIVFVLVALLFRRRGKVSRSDRMCRLFGLDPSEYQLIGSDLGGGRDKLFLRGDGVVGAPDAVFRRRSDGEIVVGEAKSRRYRGSVSTYERYQVILYLGVSRRRYRRRVRGLIRYGCGTCVPLAFEETTYQNLIALIPEYRQVSRQIRRSSRSRSGPRRPARRLY